MYPRQSDVPWPHFQHQTREMRPWSLTAILWFCHSLRSLVNTAVIQRTGQWWYGKERHGRTRAGPGHADRQLANRCTYSSYSIGMRSRVHACHMCTETLRWGNLTSCAKKMATRSLTSEYLQLRSESHRRRRILEEVSAGSDEFGHVLLVSPHLPYISSRLLSCTHVCFPSCPPKMWALHND